MSSEYERALVATVLSIPERIDALDPAPLPEHFRNADMRKVWKEIQRRVSDSEPFDAVTITDRFLRSEPDLGHELHVLVADMGPVPAHLANQYATAIVEDWRRRVAMDVLDKCIYELRAGDDSAIDRGIAELMDIDRDTGRYEYAHADAVTDAYEHLAVIAESDQVPGVPSGLEAMDRKIGGFEGGDLIFVGGRPSMGKTAFMLGLARAAANAGTPSGIISGEQPARQLAQRQLSAVSGVPAYSLRTGNISSEQWQKLVKARQTMNRWPIAIYDRSQPYIGEIVRKARQWKRTQGMGILFVDYVQRCRGDEGDKRSELVGSVCRGLKSLARDLDIPVVALAQIKREVDSRPDKRPGLADFADSSEIEKEGDRIMTIYRDEVYNSESPDKGIAEIIAVKNRHGPVGKVKTQWDGETMQFRDLANR